MMQVTGVVTDAGTVILYGVDRNGQVYKYIPQHHTQGWEPLSMLVLQKK